MRTSVHLLVVGVLALSACAPSTDRPTDPDRLALRGTVPVHPLPKVDFTLTDTRGRPYDFRKETDGKIALLYFGYTYCPDVCPLQMATLAAAMKELDADVRDRVRVVFVSVDPARDTPERMAHWLGSFDTTFIGVRGTPDQIAKALAFYNFPPPEKSGDEPNYTVGHPALVYAFTPDDLGRGMYGNETSKAIWVHDLKLMASHDWSRAAAATDTGAAPAATAAIEVVDAFAPKPAAGDAAAMYLTLLNTGEEPDTLLSVSTGVARSTSLHATRTVKGVERMVRIDNVPLPPGDTVRLRPGAIHVMLEGLGEPLEPGSTFPASLIFAHAGTVPATVRVVTYQDLAGG